MTGKRGGARNADNKNPRVSSEEPRGEGHVGEIIHSGLRQMQSPGLAIDSYIREKYDVPALRTLLGLTQ